MATYLFPANYETQGLAALGVADHDESNLIFQYLDNDLTTFIRDVANYLVIEELDEVVLVGHSYSGMICAALFNQFPHRIRQVIFVDAIIPQSERSFVDIAGEQFGQMLAAHRLGNGLVRPWPMTVFGLAGAEAAWFASRLCPFYYQAFHTPFPGLFDPTIQPASFISCSQTAGLFLKKMAEKAREFSWPVYELESGHFPMIMCPEALASLLVDIVEQKEAFR